MARDRTQAKLTNIPLGNVEIAARLDEIAELLEAQEANIFRVRAYRSAAHVVRMLDRQAHEILDEQGLDGLRDLPGIGESLARAIERLARTGNLSLLLRLRCHRGPERQFMTLPGIGLETASRIHEQLGIETMQDLEAAAYDGRLGRVTGMGSKRLRGIRDALAGRFSQRPPLSKPPTTPAAEEPSVAELLDIDREYRKKAKSGRLRRIAPQRFNLKGEAWLPILRTERSTRHYTALYSNTPRAHDLGTTRDWVVIYRDDPDGHGQWTAITARVGSLRGRRIIRGREAECDAYYAQQEEAEVQKELPFARPLS